MSDHNNIIQYQYNTYANLRKMIFDHVPVDFVDEMYRELDKIVNASRQIGYSNALNLLQNNNPNFGNITQTSKQEFTLDDDLMVDYNLSKMASQATNEFYHEVSKTIADKFNNDYATRVANDRKRFIRNLEVGSEVFYTGDVDRGEAARVISIDTRLPIDEATEVIIWLPTNVEVKTNVSYLDPLTQVFLDTRNEFMQRMRPGDRVYYCPDIGEEFYATVVSVMDVAGQRTESTPVTVENHGTLTHGTMEDISSAGF